MDFCVEPYVVVVRGGFLSNLLVGSTPKPPRSIHKAFPKRSPSLPKPPRASPKRSQTFPKPPRSMPKHFPSLPRPPKLPQICMYISMYVCMDIGRAWIEQASPSLPEAFPKHSPSLPQAFPKPPQASPKHSQAFPGYVRTQIRAWRPGPGYVPQMPTVDRTSLS